MTEPSSQDAPDTETDRRNLEYLELLNATSGESDRGLVITTAAHLELCLERILKAFLIESPDVKALFEGPYAPLGILSGKIKAAYLLGLITKDEARRVDATRKVRNIFAHEIMADFSHIDVKKMCRKSPIHDGRLSDRDAFLHMAMNTVVYLNYRDIQVAATEKRQPRTVSTGRDANASDTGQKT